MKRIIQYIFIILVMLVMFYPVLGIVFDKSIELSGVTDTSSVAEFNLQNIMDGTYQTTLSNWWDENFPGRSLLIKLRGQFLYTFINQSPNMNVTIEKEEYLFEPQYIKCELGIEKITDDSILQNLEHNLNSLADLLNENGKELYIFITPNKAHFYSDKISWKYQLLKEDGENNYDLFIHMLEKNNLKYFDSRKYIENYSGERINAPIFYSTGIHWSRSWGTRVAVAFEEYMKDNSKWDLSTLAYAEISCDEPNWPDADLYQSMNIVTKPHIDYFDASISITEEKEKPNIFIRGGSFMGQSLSGLISAGVFNKDVHLENNYYFTKRYSTTETLSDFTSYDEIDLDTMLGETDILILEVNEAAIGNMSFGFIEYVLEHPDYLIND